MFFFNKNGLPYYWWRSSSDRKAEVFSRVKKYLLINLHGVKNSCTWAAHLTMFQHFTEKLLKQAAINKMKPSNEARAESDLFWGPRGGQQ